MDEDSQQLEQEINRWIKDSADGPRQSADGPTQSADGPNQDNQQMDQDNQQMNQDSEQTCYSLRYIVRTSVRKTHNRTYLIFLSHTFMFHFLSFLN